MKLYVASFSLSVISMSVGSVACDKLSIGDSTTNNSTTEVPAPVVSDTDTTDETATAAPPAPQAENPGSPPAAGDVWVSGMWHFEGGRYLWNRGRWEPQRPGFVLIQARWVEDNGRWVRHPGRWARGPERPNEGRPNEGRPNEARPNEPRPNEGRPNEGRPGEEKPNEHPNDRR
jgi:hypothetical protein